MGENTRGAAVVTHSRMPVTRHQPPGAHPIMLSIGEFSKLSGLTVKTLRYYQECGILIPAHVDSGSGYRYYESDQVETARGITVLRELGFSIAEIRQWFASDPNQPTMVGWLETRKKAIEESIREDRERLKKLDAILAHERAALRRFEATETDIQQVDVPALTVASIDHTGAYADCGSLFGKLGRQYARRIDGKPMLLCLDEAYREEDAHFLAAYPVRSCPAKSGSQVVELPGGRALSLMYRGPYDDIRRGYAKLFRAADQRGWKYRLPTREIYHRGPGMIFRGNPENYLTEIQLLEPEQ